MACIPFIPCTRRGLDHTPPLDPSAVFAAIDRAPSDDSPSNSPAEPTATHARSLAAAMEQGELFAAAIATAAERGELGLPGAGEQQPAVVRWSRDEGTFAIVADPNKKPVKETSVGVGDVTLDQWQAICQQVAEPAEAKGCRDAFLAFVDEVGLQIASMTPAFVRREDIPEDHKANQRRLFLEQLAEEQQISPLSPPELDPKSIVVPEEGPFVYEFDIEVRPEFDIPPYKGLKIRRPTHVFNEDDVKKEMKSFLEPYGQVVPKENPVVELDDIVTSSIGLRWAADGPFRSFHLGGGPGGFAAFFKQFAPGMEAAWKSQAAVTLDAKSQKTIIDQAQASFAAAPLEKLESERDAKQLAILRALASVKAAG